MDQHVTMFGFPMFASEEKESRSIRVHFSFRCQSCSFDFVLFTFGVYDVEDESETSVYGIDITM